MSDALKLFLPSGPLALAPSAYASPFDAVAQPAPASIVPTEIATLHVSGPLVLRWSPDSPRDAMSYEWIQMIARCLFAAPMVKAVVMVLDTPGGVVSGAFETAALLRELSDASGKPLYAYVQGQACSAGYALAASAQRVFASASATIGSIGVIHPLADATKKNEKDGLRFVLVTSGARKADGNPLAPITDDAITATQEHVDELAEIFFAHVNTMRPALSVDALRGMQAATFTGQKAAGLQLIDGVSTFDRVLALAANADIQDQKPMKLKAAAQAIVDDDKASDEDKKEAKAYLASLEGDDAPKDDDKKDDDSAADDDAPKDDDKKDDAKASDDKKDDAKASTSDGAVLARVAKLEADIARGKDSAARRKILAARSDLSAAQVKSLSAVPTSALAAALGAIPAGKASEPAAVSPMAGALAAVNGEAQATASAPATLDEARARQRARMGIGPQYAAPRFEMRSGTLVLDMLATAPQAAAPKAGAQ